MINNIQRIELHKQWWKRANANRLALIYTPAKYPFGGLDIDISPADIAQRKKDNARVEYTIPKDTLVTAYVDFATALIPAMLGAGLKYNWQTSWALPTDKSIVDIHIPPFNPGHPLFQAYIQRVQAVLTAWNWDDYLPATYAYLGPLDALAGLLGPEQLAIELYEHPDHVKGLAFDLSAYLVEMVQYELDYFRKAGIQNGTPCAFNYWLPGSGFMFSEDFCALVSQKHYAQFFLEADIAFTHSVDATLLHVHSAGFQCLPVILENPYISSLELANDIDNRDVHKLIQAAKLVQEKKLPVQVSSWEHPLETWEIDLILNALDPRGLCVALQSSSWDEAQQLYAKIKSWPG